MTSAWRPVQIFQLQTKFFRGFSDRSRLAILETLGDGAQLEALFARRPSGQS